MEKRKIVIGSPVTTMGLTLVPVVEVSLNYWSGKGGGSFFGFKKPVAVVVVSPSMESVIRMTGEEVALDQFVKEFPDISETLEKVRSFSRSCIQ